MELDDFVQKPSNVTQDQLHRDVLGDQDDYSESKSKRREVGNTLVQLIGYFNREVKRNHKLGSLASARQFITRHPKQSYHIEAIDLDKDIDTPDNTVVYRNNGNIFAVDGFYTALNYEIRLTNKGKDMKVAVDNSLFTPYQTYVALAKGKITADNHWIPSDKQPSVYNAFKKLVSQNMENIRVKYSKSIEPMSQTVSRLWNKILVQAARQLYPQGVHIQEYRSENPATQALLTDVDIARRMFNTKRRRKKLDAVAFQIIQSGLDNLRQELLDEGIQ
ncbi:MAG: hypothetical protein EZS28_039394 [Streblomastix strix]|uniref:Uncharacterized protein n=1 Tax=Streblomastix strix TaxID=222440 RepID=A0A5J4U401_9EUKA|nr:MAG: hypothetical protein EZS28_039394 [Streblomastix strix]